MYVYYVFKIDTCYSVKLTVLRIGSATAGRRKQHNYNLSIVTRFSAIYFEAH